ncbi:MAG: hypothetical protein QF672_14780 [SAR202 cluster bacterium]|jgi:hypothetical protein|nr:hypothetical protein [SAR202 cluster bacterium]
MTTCDPIDTLLYKLLHTIYTYICILQISLDNLSFMNLTEKHEEQLRHRFPLLWRNQDTRTDFREDLGRTDREFGTKWRKHKSDRLADLQRHEDQLALADTIETLAATRPVIRQLGMISTLSGDLLDAVLSTPIDTYTADAIYRLGAITLRPTVAVADHDLDKVLADLSELEPDDLGISILRELTYPIGKRTSGSQLAARHDITRQSVAERRRRLEERLILLAERRPLASLRDYLVGRMRHREPGPILLAGNPFTAIAQLAHETHFPSVIDAVQAGLWLASQHSDERPRGFELQPDGSLAKR